MPLTMLYAARSNAYPSVHNTGYVKGAGGTTRGTEKTVSDRLYSFPTESLFSMSHILNGKKAMGSSVGR